MSGRLGLFEIHCDAPPYPIVRACREAGFRSPLDVRWVRLSHFLTEQASWGQRFWRQPWKALLGWGRPRTTGCTCGHILPPMQKITFTFVDEGAGDLLLGQCPRCHTIFWEEE
jgi:hypothetical protein